MNFQINDPVELTQKLKLAGMILKPGTAGIVKEIDLEQKQLTILLTYDNMQIVVDAKLWKVIE